MARVILMIPGISVFTNPDKDSSEISTLQKLEEKVGGFSEDDRCVMFVFGNESTENAARLLEKKIGERFGIKVELETVKEVSIEKISNEKFLDIINDFVSIVSKRILQIRGRKEVDEVYVSITSGYKIVSAILSLVALLHNFKIIYFFETSSELLFFPDIEIEVGVSVWLKYWNIFYFLFSGNKNISFGESDVLKDLKPFIFFKNGGEIGLTSIGELLDRRAVEIYSDDKLGLKRVWKRKFIEDCFLNHVDISKSLTLMILDIDHFKKVNDTYGHDVGDKVLYQFAKKILEASKNIFSEHEDKFKFPPQLVRWGGEEFVLIFQLVDYDKCFVKDIAETLRREIEKSDFYKSIKITSSIGVASGKLSEKDLPIRSLEFIFRNADDMVYKAKRNGRNRVEFYDIKGE